MFCNKANNPKLQNTPDTPNFWLANKVFYNNLCVYAFMYHHVSSRMYVLSYLLHFLSLHKTVVYPPLVYILYDECSEDMTGECSSAKYQ